MLTEMDSTPVFLFLVLHLIHNKISNDRTQGVPLCLFCDECQGLRNVLPGGAHSTAQVVALSTSGLCVISSNPGRSGEDLPKLWARETQVPYYRTFPEIDKNFQMVLHFSQAYSETFLIFMLVSREGV